MGPKAERLFEVSEANALIPKLELIMEQLQRHTRTLREEMQDLARANAVRPEELTTSRVLELRPAVKPVVDAVEALLREIRACGAQFKGIELGLVDFPAEIDGEVVLLCWQYGEKEIGFYHAIDEGFAGRKPLDGGSSRGYLQ
jgi:hypothetical protein